MAAGGRSVQCTGHILLEYSVFLHQASRRFSESSDKGWFRSLFVHKVDARKNAHSNLLSKKETSNLYKIQFHNVKPECLDAYNNLHNISFMLMLGLKCKADFTRIRTSHVRLLEAGIPGMESRIKLGFLAKSIASGSGFPLNIIVFGRGFQKPAEAQMLSLMSQHIVFPSTLHLWRYRGGYPALTECLQKLRANKEYLEFREERAKMLISRRNQLLLEFSFWNEPLPRKGPNLYELRTYNLKPGTMLEWGNRWARAIKYRQENNEAVGGFFSQIGDLYVVHHLWAYESLQSREETRNSAWQKQGWDVNVYYTVPLVRSMESRLMIPTRSSTLQ